MRYEQLSVKLRKDEKDVIRREYKKKGYENLSHFIQTMIRLFYKKVPTYKLK